MIDPSSLPGGQQAPSFKPDWDLLELITSASADGITIQNASGDLVYANDAAARMSGFGSAREMRDASGVEVIGRFEILDEAGDPMPADRLPGRRALRGEAEAEAVVRFRRRAEVQERWALVRATPLFDAAGEVHHVVNVFIDITAERTRQQVERFLDDAGRELVGSLDWESTLQRVAQLTVPVMADWCAVDIVQPDGSLALIALAHVDPDKVAWASELRRRFPPERDPSTGLLQVARTGESQLIPVINQELIDAADISDPELLAVVERLRLSSMMYIPLIARGRTIGVLSMVWAESGKHYSGEDVRVAEDLAARAALAIDNARLYEERDHVAQALQTRLLPRRLPRIPGIETAARYLPAGETLLAGGDFYDLFEMEDGSWKAVIGDVCGKGASAAALMGFVRFTTRAVSRRDRQPSEALVTLNGALLEELEDGDGEFCTAAVVRIRPHEAGANLTVAVAGHPLPFVIRADGAVEEAGVRGTLLGVFEDVDIADRIVELGSEDSLVMLTDGVLEASRDEAWPGSLRRLLAASAGMPAESIADRIERHVSGVKDRRTDDVAILVLQVPARP